MKLKRFFFTFCVVLILVVSCISCFAASGDQAAFVDAINDGINADSMWGAVAPNAKLIIAVFVFAFAYGMLRRVLKKGSRGKFGM